MESGAQSVTGRVKQNVEPLSGSLSAQMRPPWASTSILVM